MTSGSVPPLRQRSSEVGVERVLLGEGAEIRDRRHAPGHRADDHAVVARRGGQHHPPILLRLEREQLGADHGHDAHVDARVLDPRNDVDEVLRRARALDEHGAHPGRRGVVLPNQVEPLRCGLQVGVGEGRPIGDVEVRSRDVDDDDADLLDRERPLDRCEVAGRHVVVVPEIEVDDLAPRQERPDLRGEDPEVRARIGRGLGTRVSGQDVQNPELEGAVLVHLRETRGRGCTSAA